MSRILLVNADYDSKYYSLGIAYIKGFLNKHYPSFEVVSADLQNIDSKLDSHFDYIGVSILTHCVPEVYELMRRIRPQLPHTKFIAGSLHTTALPEQMLEIGFDHAVTGPGETGFASILDGCTDSIVRSVYRPIDYFPDFMDQTPRKPHVMPLITSFGCPFSCNFCSCGNVWNKRVYFEDLDFCFKTIHHLLKQREYKRIFVWDDNFLLRKRRVHEFCKEYKKIQPNLTWQAYSRGELITEELCAALRDANCRQLRMGIESGSDTILKGVLKGMTVETNEQAIRIQHAHGLHVHGYFLCGLPGETEETINETKEFIRRNRFNSWQVNIPLLYPDTELHKIALANGFDNSCYLTEKPKYFAYENSPEQLEKWRDEIRHLLTQRYYNLF